MRWDFRQCAAASGSGHYKQTVVARNLEHLVEQLKDHIEAGTSHKDLLDVLPVIQKAIGYIADASAESVRMSKTFSTS